MCEKARAAHISGEGVASITSPLRDTRHRDTRLCHRNGPINDSL